MSDNPVTHIPADSIKDLLSQVLTAVRAEAKRSPIRTSPTLQKLPEALAAFQAEMPVVPKNSEGNIEGTSAGGRDYKFKYLYADLGAIVTMAGPIVGKHGLSVTQWPTFDPQRQDVLTTRLMHSSGEWMESDLKLMPKKMDAQGMGGAITYARRYAYCAALGIVAAGEDDDLGGVQDRDEPGDGDNQSPRPQGQTTRRASPSKRRTTNSDPSNDAGQGGPVGEQGNGTPKEKVRSELITLAEAFDRVNIKDRDARHAFAAEVLGKPVATANDLDRAEVMKVVNALIAKMRAG